jgi:hypothetical protein
MAIRCDLDWKPSAAKKPRDRSRQGALEAKGNSFGWEGQRDMVTLLKVDLMDRANALPAAVNEQEIRGGRFAGGN